MIEDRSEVTVRFLNQLGLTVPPTLAANPAGSISQENVGLLDADLVLVCYDTPSAGQDITGPGVRIGAVFAVR